MKSRYMAIQPDGLGREHISVVGTEDQTGAEVRARARHEIERWHRATARDELDAEERIQADLATLRVVFLADDNVPEYRAMLLDYFRAVARHASQSDATDDLYRRMLAS